MKPELSDAEKLMFLEILDLDLINAADNPNIRSFHAMDLYRLAVSEAFVRNLSGRAVEALRTSVQLFEAGKHRGEMMDQVISNIMEGYLIATYQTKK